MTRGGRVCAFIEKYLIVPEGDLAGQPFVLAKFERDFILAVYDNPHRTSRAYLSIARKNGKTPLIAAILLAHLAGPEARPNSQIISGAQSRDQAAQVFNYASKMVMASAELSKLVQIVPSGKRLVGLSKNVEYKAIAADAKTAHGLSPVLAILDEVGQVRGPVDPFVESIETAQGAYEESILIAISTQASSDNDLFSIWLDDAEMNGDPHTISHVYMAPEDCALDDEAAWKAANPAYGIFLAPAKMREAAEKAERMPSFENSFRWLHLNQRINRESPFINKSIWMANGAVPDTDLRGRTVWGGLDLAQRRDMSALVWVAERDGAIDVIPTFWLPGEDILERSQAERVPYNLWAETGDLRTSSGPVIDFGEIADEIMHVMEIADVRGIAFDPYLSQALWPLLEARGFTDVESVFHKFAQTYGGMSTPIGEMQAILHEVKARHGNHPVLTFNAANAVAHRGSVTDQILLKKPKGDDTRRIDGIVAMAMAIGLRAQQMDDAPLVSIYDREELWQHA